MVGSDKMFVESMTRRCEVCGRELRKRQDRFCSRRCKAIAQTKEWQIIQELRKNGRVSFIQLTILVQRYYGVKNPDGKIADIMKLLNELGGVKVVIGK